MSLRREAAALAILLAAFGARALLISQTHFVPAFDEVAYLDQAREFHRLGAAGTLGCYLSARCRDDNRHPLYAALAAPWMEGSEKDFPRAKLVTLACGLALLGAVYAFARRRWRGAAAPAAVAALALSFTAASLAQTVLCDVLLAALYVAALTALLAGTRRGWLGFGLLAGAAYLTKATGHVLLLSAVAVAVVQKGRSWHRARELHVALAGFAAGAALLLWRNTLAWGNPFHSFATAVLWVDDWSSIWRIEAAGGWRAVGPLAYLARHTPVEAAARLLRGCGSVLIQLFETAGPGPLVSARPAGVLIVGLAGWGLRRAWREGRRAEVAAVLAPALAMLAALAWSADAGVKGVRFFLPIVASLLPAAAEAAQDAAQALGLGAPALWTAAAAGALGLLAWRGGLARDPRGLWAEPPHWAAVSAWLKPRVDDRGFMIAEDSFFSVWNENKDLRRVFPYGIPEPDLRRYLDDKRIDFALLDTRAKSFAATPGLGAPDAHGPTSFLGWPRCFNDPIVPSQLLVYCRPKS